MDFTPMSIDEIPGIDRVITRAHEMTQPVLFLSGALNYDVAAAGYSITDGEDKYSFNRRDLEVSPDDSNEIDVNPKGRVRDLF